MTRTWPAPARTTTRSLSARTASPASGRTSSAGTSSASHVPETTRSSASPARSAATPASAPRLPQAMPSPGARARSLAVAALLALAAPPSASAQEGRIGPASHVVNLGRHLTPYGRMATVGNFAAGGAVTPDGRYYWTVSAGSGLNDVRIVSTRTARVVQTIPLPGASGGVAIDPRGGTAYVSGLANSTNHTTSRPQLPGGKGDVVHVFRYSRSTGHATETRQIAVPPPSFASPPQDFPLP